MEGMIAIAVPIKDREDRFVGALAFHGPTQRISIENAVARKEILISASQKTKGTFVLNFNFGCSLIKLTNCFDR